MADRYLLESGAPDGYLLEDSSGVLILEAGTAAALDDGDSWFGGIASRVAFGLAAAAVSTATLAHKIQQVPEDLPVAASTVSGNFSSTSHNFRADQQTRFQRWWQGDDFPEQVVVNPALDDYGWTPGKPPEKLVPLISWDNQDISPKIEEEYDWKPPVIASIKVSPLVWGDSEIVPQPVETIAEESDWSPPVPIPPAARATDFIDPDFTPPAAVEEQDWAPEKGKQALFSRAFWADDDIVPQPVETLGIDEETWTAPVWFSSLKVITPWADEEIVPQPAFVPDEEPAWTPPVVLIGVNRVVWATDEEIVPQAPAAPSAGSVLRERVNVLRWHQDEILPEQAPADPIPFETDWTPTSKASPLDLRVWNETDEIPTPPPPFIEDEGYTPVPILPSPFIYVWNVGDEWVRSVVTEAEEPVLVKAVDEINVVVWAEDDPWVPPIGLDQDYWQAPYFIVPKPIAPLFDFPDERIEPPPVSISVEESYWHEPARPWGIVTGWGIPLNINEDFPELSTPPTPPRVEILGGDPVKKRKKSPREEIRDLLNEPSREKVVLAPPTPELPKPLQPVAKVVPAEYLPPIGVLPVSEPPPPAFSDEEMAEILALIHLGIL